MLPDTMFTRSILVRGAFLWAGIRLLVGFSGLLAGQFLVPTGVPVSILVIVATVGVAAIELRRQNEFLLLGSLGHGPSVLLLLSAIPAVPLEALFTVVAG